MQAATLDVQPSLLPGQAAAPPGPIDLIGMYTIHHAFRRDLDRFVVTVPRTALLHEQRWEALRRRWQRFALILHRHHAGEDAGLWPMMLDRADAAGDTEARTTLEAMESEHSHIDPLLEACAELFARLAGGAAAQDRTELERQLVATRARLGEHLAHEERDAMAVAQRYLSHADWVHVEETYFRAEYTPREMLFMVPWVLDGLPADGRARMLAAAGRPLAILGWLTALPYAFQEARAFGRSDRALVSRRGSRG